MRATYARTEEVRHLQAEVLPQAVPGYGHAASEAIRTAAGTLRDLRVAEVVKQDIHLDEDGTITYRTKLQLSFKYEPGQ